MIVGLPLALVSFAAGAHLLDGPAPPDRLVHRYEIECHGRTGAVVIEERFDRSRPSMTVAIRSVTPLGSDNPAAPTPGLERVFSPMIRIQRVEWLCERNNALLVIDYAERQAANRRSSAPMSSGRAYLLLEAGGLRPEAQPGGASPAR